MSRQAPYTQRRGDTLFFRISVPADLRSLVGSREITKTLHTAHKIEATPLALVYAATAKRTFNEVRAAMSNGSNLHDLMKDKKHKIRFDEERDLHQAELDERDRQHLADLKRVRLEVEVETTRRVMAGSPGPLVSNPALVIENPVTVVASGPVPMFKDVVDDFLEKYNKKKPAMLKKHQPVLAMLLASVGNKPIADIRQADINNFFGLLGNLPPRWSDACRKQRVSVQQLAELDHEITIGPKSFDDTYIASVRPFLKSAKKDWGDQGFPLGLTTDGIEYSGDRDEGENGQRAFTVAELKRLFEGAEMKAFSMDRAQAHRYWLPTIGLFTGARVNEICQMNPQTDIRKDQDTGINYFWITKDTVGDDRIVKSVKTGDSRKVPIHNKLIELGFLNYLARVRATGSKLLFPEWEPINKRASGNAEKWFRQFIRDTKLRDETKKKGDEGGTILGMHAFRSTLLTHGALRKPKLILTCISGHAQGDLPVPVTGAAKTYFTLSMLSPLDDRAALLNQLDYGLNFFTPVA